MDKLLINEETVISSNDEFSEKVFYSKKLKFSILQREGLLRANTDYIFQSLCETSKDGSSDESGKGSLYLKEHVETLALKLVGTLVKFCSGWRL